MWSAIAAANFAFGDTNETSTTTKFLDRKGHEQIKNLMMLPTVRSTYISDIEQPPAASGLCSAGTTKPIPQNSQRSRGTRKIPSAGVGTNVSLMKQFILNPTKYK
mmetsp:Transcript_10347/g.23943  ORF Transcript_10347/g.23943 Transcript_10347/m.23943 type:complete len:105 (-) Transcript_10347:34-348(-)